MARMIKKGDLRFNVDLNDIRENYEKGTELASYIIHHPKNSTRFLQNSLNDIIDDLNPDIEKKKGGGRRN